MALFWIKYDDITSIYYSSGQFFAGTARQLAEISKAAQGIVGLDSFQGRTAESMKAYFSDVHQTVVVSLGEIITEFCDRLLLYRNDCYHIDSAAHAMLSEVAISNALRLFRTQAPGADYLDQDVRAILRSVSDICTVQPPYIDGLKDDFTSGYNSAKTLEDDIDANEAAHAKDFDNLDRLISALSSFLDEAAVKKGSSAYQAGSIATLQSFSDLRDAVNDASTAHAGLEQALKSARYGEELRFEAMQRELKEAAAQRKKDGWFTTITSGLEAIGGIVIVAVCAVGEPFTAGVSTLGIVGGVGMIIHGASDMVEGIQDIRYGNVNDMDKESINFGRDKVFAKIFGEDNKQTAWNVFGTVSQVAGIIGSAGTVAAMSAANTGASISKLAFVGKAAFSTVIGMGADVVGTELGTKYFGPEVGRYVGLASGLLAGAAAYGGLDILDREVNFTGAYPKATSTLTDFDFKGNTLKDVKVEDLEYIKRDRAEYNMMRNEFNKSVKPEFLKTLAETHEADLKAAGLTDENIANMAAGKGVKGYSVHHIVPLDDSGTNDPSNLVLIDEASHQIPTNYQLSFCKSISVGSSKTISWPYFDQSLYLK